MIVYRKVERLTADGSWEQIGFDELKKGDRFKLYDGEGEGEIYEDGSDVYVATGHVFPTTPEGNFGIEAELAPDAETILPSQY